MSNILDEVILDVEGNPWTVRDACTGCIVFGMTGSGKSSGPLYKIANKILSLGYGGVVFCAKPDEAATWIKYAEQTNRIGDLLFLSQETFNYLDAEAKRESIGGGQVENLVNLYLEIVNLANFKKLEPQLPFKRKLVGHSVRFRNTDVVRFILTNEAGAEPDSAV